MAKPIRHPTDADMKWCCAHQEFHPRNDFAKAHGRHDGLQSNCRAYTNQQRMLARRRQPTGNHGGTSEREMICARMMNANVNWRRLPFGIAAMADNTR